MVAMCRRDGESLSEVGAEMKRIAVLMTCYNRVQTTLECLRRLFRQELPDGYALEVWLVDDASPDRTGELVKAEFPQVNVIKSPGNLYWCRGMRLAWDRAAEAYDYDYYLWLNDDVQLKEKALSAALRDAEKIGGMSPVVIVGTFSSDEQERDVSYGATSDIPDGVSPKLANGCFNGNFVLVPRQVFKRIGPICNLYHHAYGDYDYSWMLRRAGIDAYATSEFLGVCPQQPTRYIHLKGLKLAERIQTLFNPKGFSLHDTFVYRKRNWGGMRALISCIHVIVKVCWGKEASA